MGVIQNRQYIVLSSVKQVNIIFRGSVKHVKILLRPSEINTLSCRASLSKALTLVMLGQATMDIDRFSDSGYLLLTPTLLAKQKVEKMGVCYKHIRESVITRGTEHCHSVKHG